MIAAVTEVALTMVIWVGAFRLNGWLPGYLDISPVISWIFLPAAVRLLSVMLLDTRGVAGLWLGALITNNAFHSEWQSLVVAVLSAGGPWLAVKIAQRWFGLQPTLKGLTASGLLQIAVLAALCNVLPHNLFFWAIGMVPTAASGVWPMFVGDLAGIVIVFYLLKTALAAAHWARHRGEGLASSDR
jgi:hypothetical protein